MSHDYVLNPGTSFTNEDGVVFSLPEGKLAVRFNYRRYGQTDPWNDESLKWQLEAAKADRDHYAAQSDFWHAEAKKLNEELGRLKAKLAAANANTQAAQASANQTADFWRAESARLNGELTEAKKDRDYYRGERDWYSERAAEAESKLANTVKLPEPVWDFQVGDTFEVEILGDWHRGIGTVTALPSDGTVRFKVSPDPASPYSLYDWHWGRHYLLERSRNHKRAEKPKLRVPDLQPGDTFQVDGSSLTHRVATRGDTYIWTEASFSFALDWLAAHGHDFKRPGKAILTYTEVPWTEVDQ